MELLVYLFISALAVYLLVGLLFTPFFLISGISKIDEGAVDTTIWFKLVLIPGCVAFWPVLAKLWMKTQ